MSYPHDLRERLTAPLLLFVFGDDTLYAKGYSYSKFNKIKKGMSRSEVIKLLGNPIDSPDYDRKTWWLRYSQPRTGGSYYIRTIGVENDTVAWISADFYVD